MDSPKKGKGRQNSGESGRELEEAHRDRDRYLKIIHFLSSQYASEADLLRSTANEAVRLTSSRFGLVAEVREDLTLANRAFSDGTLRFCSVEPDALGHRIEPHTLFAKCIGQKAPIFVEGARKSGLSFPEGHVEIERLLAVPGLLEDKVVAVLAVANKAEPYDEADCTILNVLSQAACKLLTRLREEQDLRTAGRLFTAIGQQSVAGIGVIGPQGLIFANRTLECMTGYTLNQVREYGPMGFMRAIHPEHRDLVLKRHLARLRGEEGLPDTYEIKILRPDGEARWVTLSASRVVIGDVPCIAFVIIDTHALHEAEEAMATSLAKVRETLEATTKAVSRAVEARDPYTAGHQRRVSDLARAIGAELGLPPDQLDALRMAGLLHDVGKIAIPIEILAKPSTLNEVEFAILRQHPRIGYEILEPVRFPWPIHTYVLQHHERLDGSGYPDGLRGEAITLESRILAVADVVEAMASHRPYRPAIGLDKALSFIESEQGRSFDYEVVRACLRLFREKGYSL